MSYDTGIGIDCREFRLGRGKAAEPWATLAPTVLARIFFFATKRTGSLFSAYCSHSHHSERYDFLLITVLIYHGCMTPAGLITVLIVSSNIFHLPALHWDVF
jgi:hypothetical protein